MKKLEYKARGTSSKSKRNASNRKSNAKINVNKKRNNKSKKKIVIGIVIFVIVVVSITLLCTLPYFNISSIDIKGTNKYTKEEIIEKSGIKLNENIFICLVKGVSSRINDLPYIKSAHVKINLPSKLEINVTERESYFLAFDKDTNIFYKIDKLGYILEQGKIEEKTNQELLTYGFIFNDEVLGDNKLNNIDMSKIKVYENIKNEFEKSGINGSITKLNFENSLTTITLNDKLNVIFPNDTDIKYKMSFLKGIINNIGEDSVGEIDMTKEKPVFSRF